MSRGQRFSTDTSRDHGYTHWAAVEAFGEEVLGLVAADTLGRDRLSSS